MGARLKNVLLLGVSLLVTVVVVEVVLDLTARLKDRESAQPANPSPFYPWSFNTSRGERIGRDGYLKLAMHPFTVYFNLPNQSTPYFSTDAQGFRGREPHLRSHREGASRIVIVGGSSAFGTGLRGDRETFASHLEDLLDDTEAINAAVIGHLSGQELTYLATELVDFEPDLVIALDGWNDLIDQMQGRPRTVHTAAVNNTFFLMESRLRQLYLLESGGLLARLGAAARLVFRNTSRLLSLERAQTGESSVPGSTGGEIGTDPESIARVYAENIKKMRIIAEAFGSRFLCVLQADQTSFQRGQEKDDLGNSYDRFRGEARRQLSREGVTHVDLNDFTEVFNTTMFMDRIHMTTQGNQVTAEVVQQAIRREHLLK